MAKTETKTKKAPFGGYAISFKGQTITMEQLYGDKPVGPHILAKALWAHVKKYGLAVKPK